MQVHLQVEINPADVTLTDFSSLAGLRRDDPVNAPSWKTVTITPPEPSVWETLSFASASIDTPVGLVAGGWATSDAPATNTSECGSAQWEDSFISLSCQSDNVYDRAAFTKVLFASFGTPSGSCGGLPPPIVNASCNANNSVSVVEELCLGRTACSVNVTDAVFGDPCKGTPKHMIVVLECSTRAYSFVTSATVPVGSTAFVTVPVRGTTQLLALVTEGGEPVWGNGSFVPGDPGVFGADALADGSGVRFSVGSGEFTFVLEK